MSTNDRSVSQAPDSPATGIIVLNWNRPDDTLECLDSLLPLVQRREATLVVCDNASSDNSIERILAWAGKHFADGLSAASEDSGVRPDWRFALIRNRRNLGYAGGNNAGIAFSLDHGRFDYLWILNNDTVIRPEALTQLVECAQTRPDCAVFGCTVVDYYQPEIVQCAGGSRYDPLTTITRHAQSGATLETVLAGPPGERLDYISGAAFFVRSETFESTGYFDESFFLYYEELDFCQRLRTNGHGIAWCPSSIVFHKGAVSTAGRSATTPKESWKSNYHENLSTLIYTRKHHPLLLPIAALFRFLGKSVMYQKKNRRHLFSALTCAYRMFFFPGSVKESSIKKRYDILYVDGTADPGTARGPGTEIEANP